jgi:VCBS repeat-containing protein
MESYDLKLSSTGQGWSGTFALAVAFVLDDILSDGAPVEARLHIETEYGAQRTVTTTVTAVEDGKVITADGHAIDIDGSTRILTLEV